MTSSKSKANKRQIAEFRYSIIGSLFSRPPKAGDLAKRICTLAKTLWLPPCNDYPTKYSIRTIERWYHIARKNPQNPVDALLPKKRNDVGIRRSLTEDHIVWLKQNYKDYPSWTCKLHSDNLRATDFAPFPSYATVLRWMKSNNLNPVRKNQRQSLKERLSFEAEAAGELWHFDGHQASRKVLDKNGTYRKTKCIAFIDDYSRLCCHCQWVDEESAEEVIHIFTQAIMKRGMPRRVMSDNGSGMIAAEFCEGTARLGIIHERTQVRSAWQNGKIESFWKPLENRLLAMLEHVKPLTLEKLNVYTQAWVEKEYNNRIHSETKQEPIKRYIESEDVLRPSPSYDDLNRIFRRTVTRNLRKTDGTITIDGVRYQVPQHLRHMHKLSLRYICWDSSYVTITDPDTKVDIVDIYPVNKTLNSIKRNRKDIGAADTPIKSDVSSSSVPPLLERLLNEYKQETGNIAGYIPHK